MSRLSAIDLSMRSSINQLDVLTCNDCYAMNVHACQDGYRLVFLDMNDETMAVVRINIHPHFEQYISFDLESDGTGILYSVGLLGVLGLDLLRRFSNHYSGNS